MITRRASWLAGAFALAAMAVVLASAWRLASGPLPARHVDHEKMSAATRLAGATLVKADGYAEADPGEDQASNAICPQLRETIRLWQRLFDDQRRSLGLHGRPWIDSHRLAAEGDCARTAADLRRLYVSSPLIFAARDRWRDGSPNGLGKTRSDLRLREADLFTVNPYAALPGQLTTLEGKRLWLQRDRAAQRWMPQVADDADIAAGVFDDGLANALRHMVRPALAMASGSVDSFGRRMPAGAALELTLHPALQAAVVTWVKCYSGDVAACEGAGGLPGPLLADPRLTGTQRPRAPAAALIVAEVGSGRILAMAGETADCFRENLQREASAPAGRDVPVFRHPGDRCAQWPDRRRSDLGSLHPALWQVPPASFMKVLVTAGCLAEGVLSARERADTALALARSNDNDRFRHLALRCPLGLRAGMQHVAGNAFLIHAGSGVAMSVNGRMPDIGSGALLPPRDFDDLAARRRREGSRIERELGVDLTRSYLRSAAAASAGIGGGGTGMSAGTITSLMRDLALRAEGHDVAMPLHLVRESAKRPAARRIDAWPAQAAADTLAMLGQVTSPRTRGTAAQACRRIEEAGCGSNGLSDVLGKTGTADVTIEQRGTIVRPDAELLPAKVFGAVFEAGGRRYVAGAMVMRGRDMSGGLELEGNAGAELVLLARRWLRMHPEVVAGSRP